MFREDGRINKILSLIADLVIVNLAAFVCCLPVVTIGASVTAAYKVVFSIREREEGYLLKDFFTAFKQNFKDATVRWLGVLLAAFILFVDYRLFGSFGSVGETLQILVFAAAIILMAVVNYQFAIQAYYQKGTWKEVLTLSAQCAILNLPHTVWMVLLSIVVLILVQMFPFVIGLYFLIGITGIMWIKSFPLLKIFKKI